MKFTRFDPDEQLRNLVECYWIAEDNDRTPVLQKIIPDGFPEIIFHYGDPYKIKLDNQWEIQAQSLFAGQITKFFYLENTGRSGMVGIKFKPLAPAQLFGLKMADYTDTVHDLKVVVGEKLSSLENKLRTTKEHALMIKAIEDELMTIVPFQPNENVNDLAVRLIFSTHGVISVAAICGQINTNERKLQRLFNTWIGLSPKFFARVIRFSYIFQLAQEKKLSWSEVGLESGFYDQPHFIRNFKAFTGEDPTRYFFDEPNLANFFLNKT
jgi:AraC-like DNA-binding protein